MEAIILAGGFGKRLKAVVSDVPKPMAPLNGKPFLEYIIDNLIYNGVNRIVLAVGYKKEFIMNYFQYRYKNVEILYSIEEEPMLTGGAIKMALKLCKAENVFVVNGDTFFEVDFNKLFDYHISSRADLTLALKEMYNFSRYGTVDICKDGRLSSFYEKKYTSKGIVNGGIYCIKRDLLNKIDKDKFSFEDEYLMNFLGRDKIYGLVSSGYFVDIGIPEDYEKAKKHF